MIYGDNSYIGKVLCFSMVKRFVFVLGMIILLSFGFVSAQATNQTKITGQTFIGNFNNLVSGAQVNVTCDSNFKSNYTINGSYLFIFDNECHNVTVSARKNNYFGSSSGETTYYSFVDAYFLFLDIDMSQTDYCGDNVCNGNETYSTCSQDCKRPVITHPRGVYSTIEDYEDCEPIWTCSGWNECYDGMKSRNCVDSNNCAVSYNKPVEHVGCEISQPVLVEKELPWWVFLTGGLLVLFIGLFIASKAK